MALSLCTIGHLKQNEVIGQTLGVGPSLPGDPRSLKERENWQQECATWKTSDLCLKWECVNTPTCQRPGAGQFPTCGTGPLGRGPRVGPAGGARPGKAQRDSCSLSPAQSQIARPRTHNCQGRWERRANLSNIDVLGIRPLRDPRGALLGGGSSRGNCPRLSSSFSPTQPGSDVRGTGGRQCTPGSSPTVHAS